MANFDSADCLARVRANLNRPATDEALSDAQLYSFLTEAQQRVVGMIAANCPEAMYGEPTLLTTADDGLTYTFGTDVDAAEIFALGQVELRSGKSSGRVILPGTDWNDTTERFIFDGTKIRWPGQRTRTFTDGPYARFITPPNVVSASIEPTLVPRYARILMVYDAQARAERRLKQDYTISEEIFNRTWFNPETNEGILPALLKQYHNQGLMSEGDTMGGTGLWWRSGF